MIKCSPDEIPCCDFCIYCIHATEEDEYHAPTEPIGCGLHNDKNIMTKRKCAAIAMISIASAQERDNL